MSWINLFHSVFQNFQTFCPLFTALIPHGFYFCTWFHVMYMIPSTAFFKNGQRGLISFFTVRKSWLDPTELVYISNIEPSIHNCSQDLMLEAQYSLSHPILEGHECE